MLFFTKRLRALDTGYRVEGGGGVTQIIKSPTAVQIWTIVELWMLNNDILIKVL